MSVKNLNRLTKKQLIEKCDERGIETEGLLKQAILEKLKQFELEKTNKSTSDKDGGAHAEDDSGSEDEKEDDDGGSVHEDPHFQDSGGLKLKLINADTERMKMELELIREKARLGLGQGPDSNQVSSTNIGIGNKMSKLPAQGEQEDALSFFLNFEKIACLNDVAEVHWAKILPSLLNSTLKTHYARLPIEICREYQQTKSELLKASRMTARFYLDKFRSIYRTGQESYSQFLCRLKDVQKYYLESCNVKSLNDVIEVMLMEQFKNSLHPTVRVFVDARKPMVSAEAAAYADTCYECTLDARPGRQQSGSDQRQQLKQGTMWQPRYNSGNSQGAGDKGAAIAAAPVIAPNKTTYDGAHGDKKNSIVAAQKFQSGCWNCGDLKHRRNQCDKPATSEKPQVKKVIRSSSNSVQDAINYEKQFIIPVYVNSTECRALRDSGSHLTLVSQSLVNEKGINTSDNQMSVKCVFGKVMPLAMVNIMVSSPRFGDSRPVEIEAGVVKDLQVDLLIGHDLFIKFKNLRDPILSQVCPIESTINEQGLEDPNPISTEKGNTASVAVATRTKEYSPNIKKLGETVIEINKTLPDKNGNSAPSIEKNDNVADKKKIGN